MSLAMIQLFKGIQATPTQRLVAYMLADAHNEKTGRCDLSVASLERLTGLSDRGIQKAILGLRLAGHMSVELRNGRSNQFNLHPRTTFTSEASSSPNEVPPGGESGSPPPPNLVHATPERSSPNPEGTGTLTGKEPEPKAAMPPEVEAAKDPPPKAPPKPKTAKPDWKAWNLSLAEAANRVMMPLLASADFAQSWTRWRDYRTRRATHARVSSEAIAWTIDAAEAALRSCERHAESHGWPAVVAQIDLAIAGNWQGLNFKDSRAKSYEREPKHGAYEPATATRGKTAAQIGKF